MSGIAAVALSGCSTWSSVLETVFGGPERDGPAVIQTAGVTAVDEFPMTWEPAAQKPATWVSSQPAEVVAEVAVAEVDDTDDVYAAEDDDVMAQIADAAVLEGEAEDGVVQMADAGELSELRGGFITRFGILSIGFDIKTFINGVLQVQNIFNLVGTIPDVGGADGNPATDDGAPVTPIQLVTVTSPPGGSGPPTVTQSTPPTPTQQNVTPQQVTTDPPTTTVSNVTSGGAKVETKLNDGLTTVTNEVKGGAVQSIVVNNAGNIDIDQVTSLVIGLSDPSGFVGQVTHGVKTGNKDRLHGDVRQGLFMAISR